MVWYFIGVYIINTTLHGRFLFSWWKNIWLRSLVKYFSTLEEKSRISARPCNILYLYIIIDPQFNQYSMMHVYIVILFSSFFSQFHLTELQGINKLIILQPLLGGQFLLVSPARAGNWFWANGSVKQRRNIAKHVTRWLTNEQES